MPGATNSGFVPGQEQRRPVIGPEPDEHSIDVIVVDVDAYLAHVREVGGRLDAMPYIR